MPRRSCVATEQEKFATIAGDDLVEKPHLVKTRAISIDAPPEDVFAWIRQMGFGKAGWYSYDFIDNLGRRSATKIHAEWQNVNTGDTVPGGPVSFTASLVQPPHAFVLLFHGAQKLSKRISFSLAYELHPNDNNTRLVTRVRARINFPGGKFIAKYLLGPGDGFMLRKQLRTLASLVHNSMH